MMFLNLFFILVMLSRRLSNFLTNAKFIVSMNSCDLIFRSKGDSVARDGLKFTSMSQGLRSWSIKTS